jgi:hypothetical protein
MIRGAALLACAVALTGLSSCDDKPPVSPNAGRSELGELVSQAESFIGRAEPIVQRPWAARLEFPKRVHMRIRILQSFIQEAGAGSDAPGGASEGLLQKGRTLMAQTKPFDAAVVVVERVGSSLDQIVGYDRVIELHLPPLEAKGEAPFRIRLTNLRDQVALGFKHLDEAVMLTIEQAKDAGTHEKIASAALRDALQTSAKLAEEVKKSSALASNAVDRERLLKARLEWADAISGNLGASVPAEAKKALEDGREFANGALPKQSAEVLEGLRNAQPDAFAKAEDLGRKTDAMIEQVTRAFLDLGRKAGVGDPK